MEEHVSGSVRSVLYDALNKVAVDIGAAGRCCVDTVMRCTACSVEQQGVVFNQQIRWTAVGSDAVEDTRCGSVAGRAPNFVVPDDNTVGIAPGSRINT